MGDGIGDRRRLLGTRAGEGHPTDVEQVGPWAYLERSGPVRERDAALAEAAGAELFCVGCELVGTMEQEAHWSAAVQAVRSVFGGTLTYDTDHTALHTPRRWFDELDLLSISYYVPAAEREGASVEEMRATLAPHAHSLALSAAELGLPIMFGEVGCRSRAGAAATPSDYRLPGRFDGREQAAYLEAILTTFWDEPWWRGMYWWKWDERQSRPLYTTDPEGDLGFTLQGKPGEAVLRSWYARTDR